MRILVLGGTWFVGRAIVEDAVHSGAEVTLFGRGKSGERSVDRPRPGPQSPAISASSSGRNARSTQNSFPSGSASTTQVTSGPWPTSARRAPAASCPVVLEPRVMCSFGLLC